MLNINFILTYLDEEADQKLLEDIFYSYSKQMVSLAMTYLKNTDDAEDAVGTVFERIASRNFDVVRSIKNDCDMRNYLLKATKNTCLNMLGQKKMTVSFEQISEYGYVEKGMCSDDSFFETICNKMDYEAVLKAIGSLNEKYRDALYYHFVMEMTVAEVAKLMFQSVSATKQQLVRGKKMLLALLLKAGEENDGNHKK